MKSLTIAELLILIVASTLHAQAPDTLWTKSYGGPGDAYSVSIVPAPGGGYFVGGTIDHDSVRDVRGWSNNDFWVLRLDEQGDTMWTRTYGDSLWSEWSAQLNGTSDGGFVMAGDGKYQAGDDFVYVVRADAEGEPEWDSAYSVDRTYVRTVGIDQTMNGSYLLTYNSVDNGMDFGVMRLYAGWRGDLTGVGGVEFRIDLPWALDEWAGGTCATTDGGFAICGWTTSLSVVHEDLFLMKSSAFGVVEWTKTYDSPWVDSPGAVKQTTDGGFIVVGDADQSINSDVEGLYLLKTDADGEKEWSRSYEGSDGNDVIELPDGGFLVTGWDGNTIRVSSTGELLWSGSYTLTLAALFSVVAAPDGGYVMAGWHKVPRGDNSVTEVYIVKLGSDGTPTDAVDNPTDLNPTSFTLSQNYPNPFNPSTAIHFTLPEASQVSFEIYNILGQRIATLVDEQLPAGGHTVIWNAGDNSSGVYLYRIQAGGFAETRKMVFVN